MGTVFVFQLMVLEDRCHGTHTKRQKLFIENDLARACDGRGVLPVRRGAP